MYLCMSDGYFGHQTSEVATKNTNLHTSFAIFTCKRTLSKNYLFHKIESWENDMVFWLMI